MSLRLKHVTPPDGSQTAFRVALSFLLGRAPGLSQQTQPEDSSVPQHDLHAETEIKRVTDEVNLLSLGTRKAFGEPIIGDDKVHICLCVKPFQKEMGISFKKDGQIPGASSRAKQDLSDVVLARELAKDVDTLLLRHDKVKPVWHLANQQVIIGKEAR